jgi:hypothetical protein
MFESNSNGELGDVFPTFSIDRSYNEQLLSIDVDLGGITALLRQKGMSDEAINNLSITMTGALNEKNTETRTTKGSYTLDRNEILIYKPADMTSTYVEYEGKDGKKIKATFAGDELVKEELTNTLVHELEHASLSDNEAMKQQNKQYLEEALQPYVEKASYSKKQKAALLGGTVLAAIGMFVAGDVFDSEATQLVSYLVIPVSYVGIQIDGIRRIKTLKKKLEETAFERYISKPEEIRARQAADDYDGSLFHIDPRVVTYPEGDVMNAVLKIMAFAKGAPEAAEPNL